MRVENMLMETRSAINAIGRSVGDEGDELFREVSLACFENRPQYNWTGADRSLVMQIARNRSRDALRRKYVRRTTELSNEILDNQSESPLSRAIQKERDSELLKAVFRLPKKYRKVIFDYFWKQRPLKEISLITDTPLNTVRTRFQRGINQLRNDSRVQAWAE